MKEFPLGEIFAVIFGLAAVFLNKQISRFFQVSQKTLWGLDYNIWGFRIPLYLVGTLFLSVGIYRIFFMNN
jgi:hypothetical protein